MKVFTLEDINGEYGNKYVNFDETDQCYYINFGVKGEYITLSINQAEELMDYISLVIKTHKLKSS